MREEFAAKEHSREVALQDVCRQHESEQSELRAMMTKMGAFADAAQSRAEQFKGIAENAREKCESGEDKHAEAESALSDECVRFSGTRAAGRGIHRVKGQRGANRVAGEAGGHDGGAGGLPRARQGRRELGVQGGREGPRLERATSIGS